MPASRPFEPERIPGFLGKSLVLGFSLELHVETELVTATVSQQRDFQRRLAILAHAAGLDSRVVSDLREGLIEDETKLAEFIGWTYLETIRQRIGSTLGVDVEFEDVEIIPGSSEVRARLLVIGHDILFGINLALGVMEGANTVPEFIRNVEKVITYVEQKVPEEAKKATETTDEMLGTKTATTTKQLPRDLPRA
jgi:hypothetical protein